MARMVTPEAPVNAVNSAHTASTISPIPDGSQPSSERYARTRRSEAPPAAST